MLLTLWLYLAGLMLYSLREDEAGRPPDASSALCLLFWPVTATVEWLFNQFFAHRT